jgi:hypothetical protein
MLEFMHAVAFEIGGAMVASFFLLHLCLGCAHPPVIRPVVVRRQRGN